MATTKRRRRVPENYKPRFTAHSLGALVDLTLAMATLEQLDQIEATAAHLDESYSLKNRVAIAVQLPTATAVAGKATWRKRGYRIGAGNKGLAIFYKRKTDKTAPSDESKGAPNPTHPTEAEQTSPGDSESPKKRWGGYGITYVWDLSQVVPADCECTLTCICERPTVPAPTPAGPDHGEFVDLVAAAHDKTNTEEEEEEE